jgi:hypothetical protein
MMPNYRNTIAQQLAARRTGGLPLPMLPPLGASPAQMQRATPLVGTPVQRPQGAPEPNTLLSSYRKVAGEDDTTNEWAKAIEALRKKWNEATPSDTESEYIYGDRAAGPR